jgi:hypothetical protein
MKLPEVAAAPEVCNEIEAVCQGGRGEAALDRLEAEVRAEEIGTYPFLWGAPWRAFADELLREWKTSDYVIVRGLPVCAEGADLLLAALWSSSRFRTYRDGKIVKTFRMSPWTTDLSHTLREGTFHTDLNTEPEPPAVTAIQCKTPDPGAPRYAVNRVARIGDVLVHLEAAGEKDALCFLRATQATMVNDHSHDAWTGKIVEDGRVRFHPETLRAAVRRAGSGLTICSDELECRLDAVHSAAMAVSTPFWLDAGDTLFVSNHRALHYRGECSVSFVKFPLEFVSRSIHVLHQMDEPR